MLLKTILTPPVRDFSVSISLPCSSICNFVFDVAEIIDVSEFCLSTRRRLKLLFPLSNERTEL